MFFFLKEVRGRKVIGKSLADNNNICLFPIVSEEGQGRHLQLFFLNGFLASLEFLQGSNVVRYGSLEPEMAPPKHCSQNRQEKLEI